MAKKEKKQESEDLILLNNDENAPAFQEAEPKKESTTEETSSEKQEKWVALTPAELQAMDAEYEQARRARQAEASKIGTYTDAVKSKRILRGTVHAVSRSKTDACWLIYDDAVTVVIPFSEAFMTPPVELVGEMNADAATRKAQMLAKCIYANISFVPTSIEKEGDDYIVHASRVTALARDRSRYFGSRAVRPVEEGDIGEAQFLCVGDYAAFVSIYGMDIRLTNAQITHRYISDLSTQFAPGQSLRVQVTKIVNNSHIDPEIEVSARPVELMSFRRKLHRVLPHAKYGATVISVTVNENTVPGEPSKLRVTMFLDGINVAAFSTVSKLTTQNPIATGDKVMFEALGVTSSGYVHGNIIRRI